MTDGGRERRQAILDRLLGHEAGFTTERLCQVCADVTGVTGAGIMLMAGDIPHGSVCTTDTVSDLIEQLQYDLGEGPCVDAYNEDRPVFEPDLADPDSPRWLAFTGPVVEAGARAVFGFPLQVGAVRLGALNLYKDRPGDLTDEQCTDALVMADVAAQAVLLLQADAAPDTVAVELEATANFQHRAALEAQDLNQQLAHALNSRVILEQAKGMVAERLNLDMERSFATLRHHARNHNLRLTDVARSVIDASLAASGLDTPPVAPKP